MGGNRRVTCNFSDCIVWEDQRAVTYPLPTLVVIRLAQRVRLAVAFLCQCGPVWTLPSQRAACDTAVEKGINYAPNRMWTIQGQRQNHAYVQEARSKRKNNNVFVVALLLTLRKTWMRCRSGHDNWLQAMAFVKQTRFLRFSLHANAPTLRPSDAPTVRPCTNDCVTKAPQCLALHHRKDVLDPSFTSRPCRRH